MEILLSDRPSGLFRCPRREGAPVGDLAEARRRRGRKLVISLRDPEVADHRIGDGRDPIDVRRGTTAARREQRCRHGRPAVYRPRGLHLARRESASSNIRTAGSLLDTPLHTLR